MRLCRMLRDALLMPLQRLLRCCVTAGGGGAFRLGTTGCVLRAHRPRHDALRKVQLWREAAGKVLPNVVSLQGDGIRWVRPRTSPAAASATILSTSFARRRTMGAACPTAARRSFTELGHICAARRGLIVEIRDASRQDLCRTPSRISSYFQLWHTGGSSVREGAGAATKRRHGMARNVEHSAQRCSCEDRRSPAPDLS